MANRNSEEETIDILLDKGILSVNTEPPFVYTTGLKSPVYVDNRLLISYPKERAYIISELVKLIRQNIPLQKIDYISSSLSFAGPFGILVAEALSLPMLLIKEAQSSHGKRNKIEGRLEKDKNVLIIEDHISTGAVIADHAKTIRDAGGKVDFCIAISDFDIDIAQKRLQEIKIKTFTLTSGRKMLEKATERGLLDMNQKKEVLEWLNDPIKWGQDRGYYSED